VLLPKCALCATAYAAALGALGLSPSVHARILEPLLVLAVAGSFVMVASLAVRRRDFVTPALSGVGGALLLAGRYALDSPLLTAAGGAVMVAAALANAARCRRAKLRPAARPS